MPTPATYKSSADLPELESEPAVPATMRSRGSVVPNASRSKLCPHPASAFSARRADAPLMPIFDEETSMFSSPDSDNRSQPLSRLPESARVLQPFFTPPAGAATTYFSRGVKDQTRRCGHGDNNKDLEMDTGDSSLGMAMPPFSNFMELSSADTLPYFPTIILDGRDDGQPPRLRLRRSSYGRLW